MPKLLDPDLLIAGAGPVGCVIAERAAQLLGWKSLIIEKRDHIAGNCHDRRHENGVLVHRYGPHYFGTNDTGVFEYLSRFTDWTEGRFFAQSQVGDRLYPFPINLLTLRQFFGQDFETSEQARKFVEQERVTISEPKNAEEYVLSRVGRRLYEAFYLGYTIKQWGRHPRELHPSVCARIPVKFNEDCRYLERRFQATPREGFTALFSKMIDHPDIEVLLNSDFRDFRGLIRPRRATVYCGPLDEYFDRSLGRLPWRSLRFEFQRHEAEWLQPCVQINYPDERIPYTRSVEIKHITGQKHHETVICHEHPTADGEPYYPLLEAGKSRMLQGYEDLAEHETRERKVYFAGRLARYKYINTDEAIVNAFEVFERIRRDA